MSDRQYDRRSVLQMSGIAVAASLAGCSGNETIPNIEVVVGPSGANEFDPAEVEIEVGQSVQWRWESSGHTVTPTSIPDGATWEGTGEPDQDPNQSDTPVTYVHTFNTAETYEYQCDNHPDQMQGTVTVTEG